MDLRVTRCAWQTGSATCRLTSLSVSCWPPRPPCAGILCLSYAHRHCSWGPRTGPQGAPLLGPSHPTGVPTLLVLVSQRAWPCPTFQAAPRATGTEAAELKGPDEAWRGAPRDCLSQGEPVTGHCWTCWHRRNGRLARWCCEILIALECKVLWCRVQFVGVKDDTFSW